MKKLFNVFLFLCMATFTFAVASTEVHADDETVTSTLTVHYADLAKNYLNDGSGLHAWGFNGTDKHAFPTVWDDTDEFGGKMVLTIGNESDDQIGLITLYDKASSNPWSSDSNKSSGGNMYFPSTLLKAKGGQYDNLDIYVFGGSSNYFIAYPDRANVLVAYYNAAGDYEENLGVHIWGDYTSYEYVEGATGKVVNTEFTSCAWGTPIQIFADGMASEGGTVGKVGMLYGKAGSELGGLIYAGDDATKKYPTADNWKLAQEAGKVHFAFVTNQELFNEVDKFLDKAFTFRIKDFGTDTDGKFVGTYAPNPLSVIVQFDSSVAYPAVGENEDLATKLAARFTLNEATVNADGTYTKGATVAIKQVDYNQTESASSEFVLQLTDASKLDNTKHYVLTYSEVAEGGKNEAEIEVDLDRKAPEIAFDFEPETLPYGVEFDFNLFPGITVTDDRDGAVNYYCVEGDESVLDTGKAGQQKVKIYAEDAWGNVATAYITFTVAEPASSSGCNSSAVVVALSAIAAASVAFIVLRKRNA